MANSDDIEIIELTSEEYQVAKQAALDKLGTTYEELECMHKAGDFLTFNHKKLWMSIGN